jgi:hypothetical protein
VLILAIASVPLIAACTPPRAEMFTAVIFAAYVNLLWHYHQSGEGPLWLLPVLMCLWVNLHLGFIAGLAMCGAYVLIGTRGCDCAFAQTRRLASIEKSSAVAHSHASCNHGQPMGLAHLRSDSTAGQYRSNSQHVDLGMARIAADTRRTRKSARMARSAERRIVVDIRGVYSQSLCALAKRKFVPAFVLASAIYLVIHAIRMEACFASITVVIGGTVLSQTLGSFYKNRIATRFEISARSRAFAVVGSVVVITCFVGVRSFDLITNRFYLSTPFTFSIFGAGNLGGSLNRRRHLY